MPTGAYVSTRGDARCAHLRPVATGVGEKVGKRTAVGRAK
jgi:hypothetical protein